MRAIAVPLLLWLLLFMLSGCIPLQVQLDAQATRIAEEVEARIAEHQGLPPRQIYERIAPSIPYIETRLATGSGVLVELAGSRYVVTNAHVMWPLTEARIVFSNGEEHLETDLVAWDMIADLALPGPIETELPAIDLQQQSEISIGDTLYLIGYPAEGEIFPQPALTRGILSRNRHWSTPGLTYHQADAAISGGQSGGILVTGNGLPAGISTFRIGGVFALSLSTFDAAARISALYTAGQDTAGQSSSALELPQRFLPSRVRQRTHTSELQQIWDSKMFLFWAEPRTEIRAEVNSRYDITVSAYDAFGETLATADNVVRGTESISFTTTTGPAFLVVEQYRTRFTPFDIEANERFAAFSDPDDNLMLKVGQHRAGAIDYPSDYDTFLIELARGDEVTVTVESAMIDPVLRMGRFRFSNDEYVDDHDSGRGLFGTNSRVTFQAPYNGEFLIVVSDGSAKPQIGGYIVAVTDARHPRTELVP